MRAACPNFFTASPGNSRVFARSCVDAAANRELKRELAERIGLCQRILRRPASRVDELAGLSVEELGEQAERLERDVTEKVGPA